MMEYSGEVGVNGYFISCGRSPVKIPFLQNGSSIKGSNGSPNKLSNSPSNIQVPKTPVVETTFELDTLKSPNPKSPNPKSPVIRSPASFAPKPSPRVEQMLEKTTEGILKAARLGDIRMLSELHREGYSLLSIDETGKTALHYGAR